MILALLIAAAAPAQPATMTADQAEAAAARAGEVNAARLWGIGGNLRLAAGDAAAAARDFDHGLESQSLTPRDRGELLLDRARAAQAAGDGATAESRSAEAARLIPQDPFLWYFRAVLAVAGNDVPRARIAIRRALALAPDDPTILFESGHVAQLAGDESGARTAWQAALKRDPAGPTGARAREALGLAGVPLTLTGKVAQPQLDEPAER